MTPTASTAALRRRLAELRGAGRAPRPLDARALAALAANPGCERRTLLDGAGVDKAALAQALGAPSSFGQSQFAFARGRAFESRVKRDGGTELIRLLCGAEPEDTAVPELTADGPAGRAERTRLALAEADRSAAAGVWTLLDHPMVELEVAGSSVYLEPDAVTVAPDGGWTVIEIKSFPILDGAADPAKVGAAARQAAVYTLALERLGGAVGERALLVCPEDFSNLPAAAPVDIRKQLAAVRRQLARLTRVEEIAAALPKSVSFDLDRSGAELSTAVESVRAAYAPECLASCELAFHCRERARDTLEVAALGRGVRGELGGPTTVAAALAAAGEPGGPATAAVRRAAALRAEALGDSAGSTAGGGAG